MWKLRNRIPSLERQTRVKHKVVAVLIVLVFCSLLTQTTTAQTAVKRYVLINQVLIPFDGFIAPQRPTGFTASLALPYGVTSSWNPSVDADRYVLERLDPFTNQWQQVYSGANTTFTINNLAIALHYFRVSACGGDWCSAKSGLRSVLVGVPPDTDADGIYDYADACADTHSFEVVDAQGCSTRQRDSDGDGISDVLDLCPNTPSGVTVSAAGCEPTTLDTDGDGVTDDLDRCDSTPIASTTNNDGCAGSQLDTDGDGITDDIDGYPLQHATECRP